MKGLKKLKELLLIEAKLKYPSVPESALQVNDFGGEKPEKREKKRIEVFLNLTGNYAAIIENRGQRKDNREVVTDILGRSKIIGSVQFIGSGMRKGIADIKAIIKAKPFDIELKRVYKNGKDRQSPDQKKEQERIENAGGDYLIVKDFEDFYNWYCNYLQNPK